MWALACAAPTPTGRILADNAVDLHHGQLAVSDRGIHTAVLRALLDDPSVPDLRRIRAASNRLDGEAGVLLAGHAHTRALAALDRTTQRYREDREGRCRDLVGEAAVQALAAMQCEACLATVVAALATPDIALQAAWALRAQPALPQGAEGALKDVLASPIHGPLAKQAARQVLDGIGR